MDLIYQILSYEIVEALGWTVLHALWQGVLAAGMYKLLKTYGINRTAVWRYRAGWLVLGSLFLASLATFFMIYELPATTNGAEIIRQTSNWVTVWAEPDLISDSTPGIERYLPIVVVLWLTGACLFMLRLAGGWAYLWRLRHTQVWKPEQVWIDKTEALAHRLGIRRSIQLLESALISAPIAMGQLKPLILFPIGALNQLSTSEVEAVLAHELAHIARHDYLFNLIQSFLEVIYYFHPGVWWISGQIRLERENCCDDTAVALTTDTLTYAKALVRLEEIRKPTPALALAFSGNKNHLMDRVKRLLQQPRKSSTIMEKITVFSLMIVAVALLSFTKKADTDLMLSASAELEATSTETMITTDTVPKGTYKRMIVEEDGRVLELEMENDEITDFSINGESVDPADHQDLVDELTNDPDIELFIGDEENNFIQLGDGIQIFEDEDGETIFELFLGPEDGQNFHFESGEDGFAWVDSEGLVFTGADFQDWAFKLNEDVFSDKQFKELTNFSNGFIYMDSMPEEARAELERAMEELEREMEEMQKELKRELSKSHKAHELAMVDVQRELEEAAHKLQREAEEMEREAIRQKGEMDAEEYEDFMEAQAEELEAMRDAAEDLREAANEMASEDREVQIELSRELAEAQREIAEEMAELHRELAEDMSENEWVYHSTGHDSFNDAIESELRNDGFYNNGNYKFDLSDKRLKINGKKQSEELFEKYRDLYIDTTGTDENSSFRVEISNDD